jgi:hypothetical protein
MRARRPRVCFAKQWAEGEPCAPPARVPAPERNSGSTSRRTSIQPSSVLKTSRLVGSHALFTPIFTETIGLIRIKTAVRTKFGSAVTAGVPEGKET